jgi:hypothetical protein
LSTGQDTGHSPLTYRLNRINKAREIDPQDRDTFLSRVLLTRQRPADANEVELLPHVIEGLPGDWSSSAHTVTDPDNLRFFQKTRVLTFQNYIRLLLSRHELSQLLLQQSEGGIANPELSRVIKDVAQCKLDPTRRRGEADNQRRSLSSGHTASFIREVACLYSVPMQ